MAAVKSSEGTNFGLEGGEIGRSENQWVAKCSLFEH
jgi:hypothetical protein